MATKKAETNYATLQQELDMILAKMQHDEVDIDEAVQAYERGMQIVKELEEYLSKAENKITKLQTKFEGK